MDPKKYIRPLLAGFILLVFAFSITPRIVLHAWFAGHKDITGIKKSHPGHNQFATATYHCACDNIVAESPFTEPATGSSTILSQFFLLQQPTLISSFYTAEYFFFSRRGPPVVS
ncbi:MAG: hypothetical protein ABIQ31_17730 [Ferruginibacter sp.]